MVKISVLYLLYLYCSCNFYSLYAIFAIQLAGLVMNRDVPARKQFILRPILGTSVVNGHLVATRGNLRDEPPKSRRCNANHAVVPIYKIDQNGSVCSRMRQWGHACLLDVWVLIQVDSRLPWCIIEKKQNMLSFQLHWGDCTIHLLGGSQLCKRWGRAHHHQGAVYSWTSRVWSC